MGKTICYKENFFVCESNELKKFVAPTNGTKLFYVKFVDV